MDELVRREISNESLRPRIRIATGVMLVVMGLLAARLWELQMIRGTAFTDMSWNNRTRFIRLPPSRGRILDATGRVLAVNRPSFTFSVVPGELVRPQEVIQTCAPILGLSPEKMRGLIDRSGSVPKFLNYPVKKNVTIEELSLIKAHTAGLEGVILEARPYRFCPMGGTLCHVIGTLGEISAKELSKGPRLGYRAGDMIGKSGIEREYEPHLKGEEGWEQIEIDAKGRQLGNLSTRPPIAGADVVLTVDADFQQFIEKIFIHRAGSIVAVDPDTGRVLAMVSKPGFDLSLFSPSISARQWNELNKDALHPLENRAIRGLYSPASTFKIVTAAAALAEKVITPQTKITCNGSLELAGQTFRCWNPYGHGKVDLHRAIVESCDIYFYHLGLKLGADRIARYASLFGLGKTTGLGLPQELPGLIPTTAWKRRNYGDYLKDGETIAIAIGQGYVVSTPIQLAMMTAAIANGGKLLKPAIVQQIRAADGSTVFDHSPVLRWQIPLNDGQMSALHAAFRDVIVGARGTGKKGRIPGIHVCGKTGTSQVIRVKKGHGGEEQVPYHERSHALFVAYVNDQPKKIALVVVVEHGGGGGASAAPLAREIICHYYGVPDPGDPEE
jgi:penicillin-binding protein 2